MIYFLSSVPNKTFDVIRKIFTNDTGASPSQSKKGKGKKRTSPKAILGSTFKPFRGLTMDTVHDLLCEVSKGTSTLKEATKKCQDIKALQKVQTAFIQVTKCDTWDTAVERYPYFTTSDMLEPFKTLDFSDPKKVPAKFFSFCQHVMDAPTNNDQESSENFDQDNHFRISHYNVIGLIWKTTMEAVDPPNVKDSLASANVSRFPGFSLSIFDIEGSTEVNNTVHCINAYVHYV